MSGTKCKYVNCGRSARNTPGLKMHRFPKDDSIANKWIENCGNDDLLKLSPKALRRQYICENHFNISSYNRGNTKRLLVNSIPQHYECLFLHVTKPTKTYSHNQENISPTSAYEPSTYMDIYQPSTSGLQSSSSSQLMVLNKPSTSKDYSEEEICILTPKKSNESVLKPLAKSIKRKLDFEESPRKKKLKQIVGTKNKRIKREIGNVSRLKNKIKFLQSRSEVESFINKAPSKTSKTLVRMQLLRKRNTCWKSDERELALNLYYKSPSTYRFMYKKGISLPAMSTIRSWIGQSKFFPGFSRSFLDQLKTKVATMTDTEKICVVCFDEMTIKRSLEYNKSFDRIEGFEDFGNFKRKPAVAKEALVFMIKGLYSAWKLPLSYILTNNGVKYTDLKEIILENIKKAQECGLIPKAITCDQGSANRSAIKSLGVYIDQPYFYVGSSKIFSIYDVPHLFKSVRNNLLSGNFIVDDSLVSMEDIRKTYEIDRRSESGRALLKITPAHLNPNPFQKLNCRLALQVLSRTMSIVIKTCVQTGELNSDTAESTASFIEKVDKLFDSLNSRVKYDKNPNACSLSEENVKVKENLLEGITLFKNIEKKNWKRKNSRPPCFDGLLQSIQAILQLWEDQKENGFTYLLTSRLNQDPLENLFSIFRQKGGYCKNPTARLFRTLFRQNVLINITKAPTNSNCEMDSDSILQLNSSNQNLQESPNVESDSYSSPKESTSSSSLSSVAINEEDEMVEDEESSTSLKECATVYLAGYLAKKCSEKFKCENCKILFCKEGEFLDKKKELLILNRNYDNQFSEVKLVVPSYMMTRICETSLQIFNKNFESTKDRIKLKKTLTDKVLRKLKAKFPEFLISASECSSHIRFITELLIVIKIFNECKFYNIKSKKLDRLQIVNQ